MAAGMDMSLEQLINKSTARRKNTTAHGPNRHLAVRNPVRMTPYSISQFQVEREAWERSCVDVPKIFFDHGAVQPNPITKLYLSNLHDRVSNEDIHLLFSEDGELESYSIHYDQFGRSKGTAEVVFTKQSDALAALKRYNNMRLDGKLLQIELVGTSMVTTAAAAKAPDQSSLLGRPNDVFVRYGIPTLGIMSSRTSLVTPADAPLGRSGLLGRPNDVFIREERKINSFKHVRLPREKGPAGKVSVKEAKRVLPKLSVKDLDEDLEKYHSEAKQIRKKFGKGNQD